MTATDAHLDAITAAASAALRGGNAAVLHALLTPAMVINIVNELIDHRQPGTKPDFQEWGTTRTRCGEPVQEKISEFAEKLREEGATWLRVTNLRDRFYVDGWKERPAKEARFEILGEQS